MTEPELGAMWLQAKDCQQPPETRKILGSIMESGVLLLTALKPIKRQGWWKGKFALFQMLAAKGSGRGWEGPMKSYPKADSPH